MPTILDPYRDHLKGRWQAGCRNAAELARGLIRAGVDIHPRVVRDWAMSRRRASMDVMEATPSLTSAPPWRPPSINRTAWLLQEDPSTLVADDRRFLDRLRVEAPDLAKSVAVATRFADLVRRRSGHLQSDAMLAGCRGRLLTGIALIDEGNLDALTGRHLHGLGEPAHLGPIIGIGGRDVQRQKMAEGVHRHVQLRALLALGPMVAGPLAALGRGAQSPAVEHSRRRLRRTTRSEAQHRAQILGPLLEAAS